jgi:hypothetical protein
MISVIVGAGRKDRVLPRRGITSPLFMSGDDRMSRELSIFVDESGDFGGFEKHSPFYIVTLVFHDQSMNISSSINHLNMRFSNTGLPDCPIHTGPLIRREKEYQHLSLLERKQIFNLIYYFVRATDIAYYSLVVEKKPLADEIELIIKITKQLSAFLNSNFSNFMAYDRIIVYYDYGQTQLAKILVSVFNAILNNVEFKKINPADYKLCQAADMFCTMELLALKAERMMISKSELSFFSSEKNLRKPYLNTVQKKRYKSRN